MANIVNQRGTLHKRAERLLRRNPERISGISGKSVPELVHDLAVYQIELDLQHKDQLIDITKRKMTEAQLRESEERYRVAIENSNDGVTLVRGDRHVYVNRKFLEIFGYRTPEEVIGKTHYLTVHLTIGKRLSATIAGGRGAKQPRTGTSSKGSGRMVHRYTLRSRSRRSRTRENLPHSHISGILPSASTRKGLSGKTKKSSGSSLKNRPTPYSFWTGIPI